jgi:hypothetical protein
MRWLFAVTVLAGCAETAPTTFVDPPIKMLDAHTVAGPSYTMHFSDVGIGMPDIFTINGVQVLGTDTECNKESLIGVALFPAINGIAGNQGVMPMSKITQVLGGPAVAQIQVDFSTGYTCGTVERFAATSTFTFFPNGRIVRKDAISPSTHVLSPTNPCGCGDNSPFFLTTFWAFDEGHGATTVDAAGDPVTDGVGQACTMYPDKAIGVAWGDNRTRFHPNKTAAHVFDILADVTSIPVDTGTVVSAIQVFDQTPQALSDCGEILSGLQDGPIKIGSMTLPMTGDDGIYFDETPHPGSFTITTSGSRPVPSGFAVSVDIGNATHVFLSKSPAGSEEIALVQRVDEKRVIFVFRDGLSEGDTITIEPS